MSLSCSSNQIVIVERKNISWMLTIYYLLRLLSIVLIFFRSVWFWHPFVSEYSSEEINHIVVLKSLCIILPLIKKKNAPVSFATALLKKGTGQSKISSTQNNFMLIGNKHTVIIFHNTNYCLWNNTNLAIKVFPVPGGP